MIRVFAKHNTSEKVIITCDRQFVGEVQNVLTKKFGGRWLLVDQVHFGEFIKFDDGLKYQGYHGKQNRYIDGVHKIQS